MRLSYFFSGVTALLHAAAVGAAVAPAPPGVAFLYNANITVGLTVDVGSIPAGNVSVIPVIGGALVGPKISGKILAIGADWGLSTPQGFYYSDMRAQIRTMDNANIYVQMTGLMQGNNGVVYVRTTFQTGHKDYWWLNYAFTFGTMRASGTGYVVDMWYLTA
ncbi:hypothetical protein QBC34DRAFT_464694 [Podospora aff. communis PSN243]|uniref:Uncharacterized protein n=1 Tax=Podospora aff. communis PSN243 TaxID=3040156 RepID=A0AAV9GN76_9PEZI|nr:hypothetical protein QBC34DRAFT_464694 [Podospora aff. communis PSN243]